jgi:hypothetical protein
MILGAVERVPTWSLAELRRHMPPEYQGRAFDEAVLRLSDERKVLISQDADPSRFSPEEKAPFVQNGDVFFTTIARWRWS